MEMHPVVEIESCEWSFLAGKLSLDRYTHWISPPLHGAQFFHLTTSFLPKW